MANGGGMSNIRIFHGFNNITGSAAALAQAERALGFDSKCIGFSHPTANLKPDIYARPTDYAPLNYALFEEFANQFDVFVFYYGLSFAGNSLADIPLLKKMGKKVIFYFRGCDIQQSKLVVNHIDFCMCAECWPRLCNRNMKHAKKTAEKYADAIWVSTVDQLGHVDGATFIPQSVCLDFLPYSELSFPNGEIKIVHSPTSTSIKGTEFIIQAISELKKELPVELVLLKGLSWDEAHAKKIDAHFAVDQLRIGWYGVASIEFMAMGKPTICFIDDFYLKESGLTVPIISANPYTIKDVLFKVCTDEESYLNTIRNGRTFVEEVHDAKVIARKTIEIYESLF